MPAINYQDTFLKLVEAHDELDDDEFNACKEILESSGHLLRVEIDEDIEWEESSSDAYQECPLVTQTFSVFLGQEKIYEGQRIFGSELVDPTHTGTGGRWEAIQVDMGDEDTVCGALAELGHEVEWPEVPPWK
jgi:hypothetical protein